MYKKNSAIICRLFACINCKFLFAMKLTIIFWMMALIQVSAASRAQNINLHVNNAPFENVLDELSKQSGYHFLYDTRLLNIANPVSINTRNGDFNKVLTDCFVNQPFTYVFKGKDIILKPQSDVQAVNITVNGTVTDSNGQPLPGVTVKIKGTQTAVMTNAGGNFKITVPDANTILVFSYIGYAAQEINVANRSSINVVLTEEKIGLNEVTISYGKQRQRDITGSVAELKMSGVKDMPVGQFAQQLQGKIAGVQVSQYSGQPGRGMDFRIRGAASLSAGNSPLFVIDGLPISGSINNISPDEIETITVLKDASATALYGSRADNGVVLITTKHAKPGESKITLDSYYGVQAIPQNKVPEMMTAQQFAQYMYDRHTDAVLYEKNPPALSPVYANPGAYGQGTNWFNVITRKAPTQSHNLTILSSKDHSSSAVMLGYENQQGVLVNTGTQLLTLRINNDYSFIDDKLKVGFNLAPSYRMDHNNRLSTDGLAGIYEYALEASPLGVPVNPDGSYPYNVNTAGMVNNVNPYAQLMEVQNYYNTTRILGNAYANYELLPGLLLKTNVGIDKGVEVFNGFVPSFLTSTKIATGNSTAYDTHSWTAEANLQYSKTINDHTFEALVGYSAQKYDSYNNEVKGQAFPNDDVPYLSAASTITGGGATLTEYALLSAIGRLNYSYKGKYLLSGAIRRDGSSRFGNNKKYGSFPSVSAGWIISEEDFMKKFTAVDFLKVRASYGITGNNNIGPGYYTAISQIGNNLNYYANGQIYQGATITTLGNDDLAWERNKQLDLGFDINLLNNRINITYDYYHKFTDGMIQDRPIPRSTGFTSIKYNVGEFELWGHEFTVNTTNLTGKLKWNTSLNMSFDRNRIKSLVSPGYIDYGASGQTNYYRNAIGHSLSSFYGYVFEGLYKDAADLASSAKYSGGSTFSDIGTIKFKDLNGNGVIEDVNDRTFIGDPTPDFLYGMTNNFAYKNLDLSISIAGQVGGDLLNVNKWTHLVNMDAARNLLAEAADRWRSISNPGSGVYPRTETNTTALGRYANSQWVESGTYLTVKNISLGYTFKLKENKPIKSLRAYASVQQAFVFTGYSGMSPEANLSGLDATRGIGIDVNSYPVPRTFSLGVTANFK